jgi:hypothetical protein
MVRYVRYNGEVLRFRTTEGWDKFVQERMAAKEAVTELYEYKDPDTSELFTIDRTYLNTFLSAHPKAFNTQTQKPVAVTDGVTDGVDYSNSGRTMGEQMFGKQPAILDTQPAILDTHPELILALGRADAEKNAAAKKQAQLEAQVGTITSPTKKLPSGLENTAENRDLVESMSGLSIVPGSAYYDAGTDVRTALIRDDEYKTVQETKQYMETRDTKLNDINEAATKKFKELQELLVVAMPDKDEQPAEYAEWENQRNAAVNELKRLDRLRLDSETGMTAYQRKVAKGWEDFAKKQPLLMSTIGALVQGAYGLVTSPYQMFGSDSFLTQGYQAMLAGTQKGLTGNGQAWNYVYSAFNSVPMTMATMFVPPVGVALTQMQTTADIFYNYSKDGTLDQKEALTGAISGGVQTLVEFVATQGELRVLEGAFSRAGVKGLEQQATKLVQKAFLPSWKGLPMAMLENVGQETMEENVQYFTDLVTKHIVNGDPYPSKEEMIQASIQNTIGAATGSLLISGVGGSISLAQSKSNLRSLKAYSDNGWQSAIEAQKAIDLINQGDFKQAESMIRKSYSSSLKETSDKKATRTVNKSIGIVRDAINAHSIMLAGTNGMQIDKMKMEVSALEKETNLLRQDPLAVQPGTEENTRREEIKQEIQNLESDISAKEAEIDQDENQKGIYKILDRMGVVNVKMDKITDKVEKQAAKGKEFKAASTEEQGQILDNAVAQVQEKPKYQKLSDKFDSAKSKLEEARKTRIIDNVRSTQAWLDSTLRQRQVMELEAVNQATQKTTGKIETAPEAKPQTKEEALQEEQDLLETAHDVGELEQKVLGRKVTFTNTQGKVRDGEIVGVRREIKGYSYQIKYKGIQGNQRRMWLSNDQFKLGEQQETKPKTRIKTEKPILKQDIVTIKDETGKEVQGTVEDIRLSDKGKPEYLVTYEGNKGQMVDKWVGKEEISGYPIEQGDKNGSKNKVRVSSKTRQNKGTKVRAESKQGKSGVSRQSDQKSGKAEETDPATRQKSRLWTDTQVEEKTTNIPDSFAEDALLGLFKNQVQSVTHKDRTMFVKFKDGRELQLNRRTGLLDIKDAHGTVIGKAIGETKAQAQTVKGSLRVIVDLVDGFNGGNRTLYHEAFHVAWKLFLTQEQIDYITRYYGRKLGTNDIVAIEEAAADAAEKWLGKRSDKQGGLIGQIWGRFWDRVRHALVSRGLAPKGSQIKDIFRKMEQGQLEGKGAQEAESREATYPAYGQESEAHQMYYAGNTSYKLATPTQTEIAESERQMAEVRARYEAEPITYYNSHGEIASWNEIKDLEVSDRENYTTKQFNDWAKKYNIASSDKVLWVTPDKAMAHTYGQDAGIRDKILAMSDKQLNDLGEIYKTDSSKGFIIPESDDGDNGYLFVIRKDQQTQHKDGWLKAPNGKDTNLNERQWVQVRTPNFLRFFGDWLNDPKNASKVVDENGEPRIMFNGRVTPTTQYKTKTTTKTTVMPDMFGENYDPNKFTPFSPGMLKQIDTDRYGAFFSDSRDYSEYYGEYINEVFLNIRNPAMFTEKLRQEFIGDVGEFQEAAETAEPWELLDNKVGKSFSDWLKKHGYDGYIYDDPMMFVIEGKTHAVFSPTQIKSATANVGTFDPENADIRYKKLQEHTRKVINVREEQRKRWAIIEEGYASLMPNIFPSTPQGTEAPETGQKQATTYNTEPKNDPAYDMVKKIVSQHFDSAEAIEDEVIRLLNAARRDGQENWLYLLQQNDPKVAQSVIDQIESNKVPADRNSGDNVYHQADAEADARQMMRDYASETKITLAQAKVLGEDGYTWYLMGLIKKLEAESYTEQYNTLLEKEEANRRNDVVDRKLYQAKALLAGQMREAVVAHRGTLSNAAKALSHAGRVKKEMLQQYRKESEVIRQHQGQAIAEIKQMRLEMAEVEKRVSEIDGLLKDLTDVMKERGMFKFEGSNNDLNKMVEGYKTEKSDLLNHLENLKGTIKDMTEAMQADEAYVAEVDRVIEKSRRKGEKATAKNIPLPKLNLYDYSQSLYYNWILSSPVTHAVNMGANTINGVMESVVNVVMNPLSGFWGLGAGAGVQKKALKAAVKEFKSPNALAQKYQLRKHEGKLYNILNFNLKLMSMEDQYFYTLNYANHMASLAAYESRRLRKQGINRTAADLFQHPTENMIKQAEYEAKRSVFNQTPEGWVGAIVNGMQKAYYAMEHQSGALGVAGKLGAGTLRFVVMPFTRIVGNVANATIDWSPLGVKRMADYLNKDGKHMFQKGMWEDAEGNLTSSPYRIRNAKKQAARAAIGTVLMSVLSALALTDKDDKDEKDGFFGYITGSGSKDYTRQQQMEAAGFRRNSIWIKGRYYPYMDTPAAIALTLAGEFHDYRAYNQGDKPKGWTKPFSNALLGTAKSFLDKNFLSGLESTITAIVTQDENWLRKEIAGVAAVPFNSNILRFIGKIAQGNEMYSPETLGQQIWMNIPLVSRENVPAALTPDGEPIPKRVDMFGNIMEGKGVLERIIGAPARASDDLKVIDKMGQSQDMRDMVNLLVNHKIKIPVNMKHEIKIADGKYITLRGVDKQHYQEVFQMEMGLMLLSYKDSLELRIGEGRIDDAMKVLRKASTAARKEAQTEFRRAYNGDNNRKLQHKYEIYTTSKDTEGDQ